MVIVVSEKLLKTKGVCNVFTYLVPNGVDYESYEKALLDNGPLPADIARLPRPVIGYSGLISRRLDLGLVKYVATTNPEWSLVLIGKINDKGCESQMNRLRQMKNVHFLGEKKLSEIPDYVKAFDVGIVPYMINEETDNLSSLKLYDFMAVGMPIIATNFPATQEFQDVIYVADLNENFTASIENALVGDGVSLAGERKSKAAQNTWEHRVSKLSNIIQACLKEKY